MALGSTQPLLKMITRNNPGGKDGRCLRLTTSPPLSAECHENPGALNAWNPLGHTGPVTGLLYLYYCALYSVQRVLRGQINILAHVLIPL